jgi:hypothetical protein
MGQDFSSPGQGRGRGQGKKDDKDDKKRKWEPPAPPPRVGRKQKKKDGSSLGGKLPTVTPNAKCKLRLLKLERVKDYLLMEEEFVANQVSHSVALLSSLTCRFFPLRDTCPGTTHLGCERSLSEPLPALSMTPAATPCRSE